jgi:hypothetical protein
MPRERRFFVAFATEGSSGESQQQQHVHQPFEQQSRPIEVTIVNEEEHLDWIRDCAQQERQRLGQQSQMGDAVARMIQGLQRKGESFL